MPEPNHNAFRPVLEFFHFILEEAVETLKDSGRRNEVLEAIGIDGSQAPNPGDFPSLDEVKAFIEDQADEVKIDKVIGAVTEVIAVVAKIIEFLRNLHVEVDENKLLNIFLNHFVLAYIKEKTQEFYKVLEALKGLVPEGAGARDATGGGETLDFNFVQEIVVKFFDKLSQGKTEEAEGIISDLPMVLLMALLTKADQAIENTADGAGFKIDSNLRTLPGGGDSKTLEVTFNNGGANAFVLRLGLNESKQLELKLEGKGEHHVNKVLDDNKRLKIDAIGNGEVTIGKAVSGDANLLARANFLHRREEEPLWSILSGPLFKFAPGTYQVDVQAKNDDLQFTVRFDLKYEFGRGTLSGFPFDFLPEDEKGKQSVEIGWSMKRSFFGNGSSVGAENEIGLLEVSSRGLGDGASGVVAEIIRKLINLLTMTVPLQKNIGGILGLETLYIAGNVNDDLTQIGLEASLDFWIKLGPPITVNVSRLGVLINMNKTPDGSGIFGYSLAPDIKFPTGAGVVVNASVITGGGFLYMDKAKGEYFGALQLSFKQLFDLKAVGIINTKMPDGSDGFSMFILITAEFSAIQLGFGFTLLGVGGMLGINRGMEVEPLRVGLRTGAIRSVLFPEDVVGNVQRIISDIKQIFPIREDHFVIGLMAKIGWGTPTLISIELGVLVELPDPKIVIIGIIKCVLPAEDAPLLKLQVNFLGVIDFQNEFIYFEARLFDSEIVGLTITGSLAFAVAWGKNSTFGISVGGFHPDFKDYPTVPTLPGAFRDMDRIGIQLLSGDNPRLGVEAYFAVTSNSVQFGARAELLAEGPFGFNLYGCLAFDALFIFNPFSFIISLEATLAIRHNTSILFGIHFKGRLSGPRPWNVAGEVSFSVFPFVTITVGFDVTWGDPPLPEFNETKDLLLELKNEIRKNNNWKVELPDYHNLLVTLRELSEEEQTLLLVHPFGRLVFSQRTLPLDYDIQKFGEFKPENIHRFSISAIRAGSDPNPAENDLLPSADVKELFAAGNYTNLSESEKLSRKSFELFNSGKDLLDEAKVKTPDVPETTLQYTAVNYEFDYLTNEENAQKGNYEMQLGAFQHLSRSAAVSKSGISWSKQAGALANSPHPIQLNEAAYLVVREDNMEVLIGANGPLQSATQAEAIQMLRAWEDLNPDQKGELQVIELHELYA